LRIVFMGTPDFAVPALAALLEAGHQVAAVYTQPPRAAGRGMAMRKSPVHEFAERRRITVRTPVSLKSAGEQQDFAALDADAAVVVAYGLLLPQAVLDTPGFGCLNIHASLLPRWRGAAPIQRAILAGDTETGVAIMKMAAGLDTGPVALVRRVAIGEAMNAGQLHDVLAAAGAEAIVEALTLLAAGRLRPAGQSTTGVTYAAKIDKAETRIDWSQPAVRIRNAVRAFAPSPGAWCAMGGERLKVLEASLAPGSGAPGTILDERLAVACGQGALRIERMQRQGKQPMAAAEFLRGQALRPGDRLG
jgi:methionyl-tRNA formyltransferase